MQRICFHLQIRPERVEEYRQRHLAVWPEMKEALRETGWRNYSLFLAEDGLLTGYLECEDFEASLAAMGRLDVNARWQEDMTSFFQGIEGSQPDRSMRPLLEIFHID
ncbi:MAG: L-rhamnose mutarotase [Acidimicrobiales bacterium]|jgi:L-rhamnose mutarotase